MLDPALAAYKEAVALDPTNLATKKSLASAYERKKQFHESRVLYEEIVAKAKEKGDKTLARECRTRNDTGRRFHGQKKSTQRTMRP